MRALLYFAVTYLAHHFPEVARSEGLAVTCAELLADGPMMRTPVHWQPPRVLDQIPRNPFRFGHTVVISLDAQGKNARALISLWGVFNFGMELGPVDVDESIRAITSVDPFADRPPDDILETKEAGKSLELIPNEEATAYLRAVVCGELSHPLEPVFEFATANQRDDSVDTLLDAVLAAAVLAPDERDEAILAAVSAESQRVLNMLMEAVDAAKKMTELPAIEEVAKILIAKDANAYRGVSQNTSALLNVALILMGRELRRQLLRGKLSHEGVSGLLGGPEGALLARKVVAMVLESTYASRSR